MARGKAFNVGGLQFARQCDLDAKIKSNLNSHSLNAEFEDTFLSSVVNEMHAECIQAGQKVQRFIYLTGPEQERRGMDSFVRYRGKKLLMGWFEPLGDWRDVTVYPHRKSVDISVEIKKALRERAAYFYPKRCGSQECEADDCSTKWGLEYDHVSPTFDEIAERCLNLMTREEISTRFGYSKFTPGRDEPAWCIPDDHPAIVELRCAHEYNRFRWLCPLHHRNVGV